MVSRRVNFFFGSFFYSFMTGCSSSAATSSASCFGGSICSYIWYWFWLCWCWSGPDGVLCCKFKLLPVLSSKGAGSCWWTFFVVSLLILCEDLEDYFGFCYFFITCVLDFYSGRSLVPFPSDCFWFLGYWSSCCLTYFGYLLVPLEVIFLYIFIVLFFTFIDFFYSSMSLLSSLRECKRIIS